MKLSNFSRQSKPRSGFTLTELSAAMIAGSTLMALAISMVHHSFNWSTLSKQRVVNDQSFDRLQRQFRDDVHQANEVSLSGDTVAIKLPGDRSVQYSYDESTIHRVVQVSDDQKEKGREQYRFGEDLTFAFVTKQNPERIVLSGTRIVPLTHVDPPIWRHVEAVVGRTNRLIDSANNQGDEQ